DDVPLAAVIDTVSVGADQVRSGGHADARAVRDGRSARRVRANVVPLDRVGVAVEFNPEVGVAADDVPRCGRAAANGVERGGGVDEHAMVGIGQRGCAGGVGADVVAGDGVAGRAALQDVHAIRAAADDVAFLRVGDAVGVGANAIAAGSEVDY